MAGRSRSAGIQIMYLDILEWSAECGLLGELDFKIEFEYEPADEVCGATFTIYEVKVCIEDKWITLDGTYDFSREQEDQIRSRAIEQYEGRMHLDRSYNAEYRSHA